MESSSKVVIGSKFDMSKEVFMSGIIGATVKGLKQKGATLVTTTKNVTNIEVQELTFSRYY